MEERGAIHNRKWGHQIIDYRKIRWDNITPTDLDGYVEFSNKCFVLIEFKYGKAVAPDVLQNGQRLAMERLCDAVWRAGKVAALMIVSHDNAPPEDIKADETIVSYVRFEGVWRKAKEGVNLITMINYVRSLAGID